MDYSIEEAEGMWACSAIVDRHKDHYGPVTSPAGGIG